MVPEVSLFSDAEARKDHPQQVVGGELAGDPVDGFLGEVELFRHQLEGVAGVEAADAGVGFAQGDEVMFARGSMSCSWRCQPATRKSSARSSSTPWPALADR